MDGPLTEEPNTKPGVVENLIVSKRVLPGVLHKGAQGLTMYCTICLGSLTPLSSQSLKAVGTNALAAFLASAILVATGPVAVVRLLGDIEEREKRSNKTVVLIITPFSSPKPPVSINASNKHLCQRLHQKQLLGSGAKMRSLTRSRNNFHPREGVLQNRPKDFCT